MPLNTIEVKLFSRKLATLFTKSWTTPEHITYDKVMKQSRLLFILLRPSMISFFCTSIFAGATLLGSSWTYLKTQSFFSIYLSGEYNLRTLLGEINTAVGHTLDKILSYNILVVSAALLAGLIVYVLLQSLTHMHEEISSSFSQIEYTNQDKASAEKELERRIGLRVATAVAWLLYAFVFFDIIVPFTAAIVTKNSMHLNVLDSIYNFLIFLGLWLATHIHIIFLRLLLLRPRVFGANNILAER